MHEWNFVADEPGKRTWRTPAKPGNRVYRCHHCDLRTEVPAGERPPEGWCWKAGVSQ